MENASKALIIAGSILVVIIIITIGISIVSSSKGTVDTGKSGIKTQEIMNFNEQFTKYIGTRRGSELREIVNLVNASNATNKNHKVAVFAPVSNIGLLGSRTIYNVEVKYSTGSMPSSPEGTKLAGELSASEEGYVNIIIITTAE